MPVENLFSDLPTQPLPAELVDLLASQAGVRIKRIVSTGQASPDDFWYDQDEHEWVTVLQGAARLCFDDGEVLEMRVGDHLVINAHRKHRVDWTTPEEVTVWLAVFYPA
ncbi:cupin domain-containing protein [Rhodopirellula sp. MGV]|uniref:cupin domain-containing protein n=1 Tax=Rhodopirellula sp. MGV TaxID=2023130 RepID=UPI000B95D148|nr:cupin domain-containing protein [Rhodopirellula sp. MGV]OYP38287.1 phosphoribosylaminoimidazole carboxylase [Rhodopirellula sp. MGV]PNY38878.1 cupin domain-containing protein [Rhodopirellula baltica]